MNFFMIERYSFMPLSFAQRGSVGSLRKTIEIAPSVCFLLVADVARPMMLDALETAFM